MEVDVEVGLGVTHPWEGLPSCVPTPHSSLLPLRQPFQELSIWTHWRGMKMKSPSSSAH